MTANFSEALPRALLSDQVYAMVRGLVLDGSLPPGTRIVESEIARQLGVSQAPVREAVENLDAEAKQALEQLVEGMREAARVNDLAAFRGHDMAFHRHASGGEGT
jgi:DNA-binding GntR family transcriptional regulator